MGRKLLHLLNGLITCAVVVTLAIAGAYAGYSLWDNQQVYDAVENVNTELRAIRATMGLPTLSAMEQLLEENRQAREARAAEETEGSAASAETGTALVAASDTVSDTALVVTSDTASDAASDAALDTAAASSSAATVVTGTADETAAAAAPVAEAEETVAPEEDDSPFGQLKAVNQDITAWLTMPGTAIDYPVLQGSTNYSYINTDVYGNFALAGSIFLDSRNQEDYTDIYNLLYGHNMAEHRMFSDVNLYKDEKFFEENTLGMLLMPDGCHILESLSVIVVPASDSGLFNPENWTHLDGEGIFRQAQENALFTCEDGLEALQEQIDADETPRLVALSTCSDEFTDARTILLTLMDP